MSKIQLTPLVTKTAYSKLTQPVQLQWKYAQQETTKQKKTETDWTGLKRPRMAAKSSCLSQRSVWEPVSSIGDTGNIFHVCIQRAWCFMITSMTKGLKRRSVGGVGGKDKSAQMWNWWNAFLSCCSWVPSLRPTCFTCDGWLLAHVFSFLPTHSYTTPSPPHTHTINKYPGTKVAVYKIHDKCPVWMLMTSLFNVYNKYTHSTATNTNTHITHFDYTHTCTHYSHTLHLHTRYSHTLLLHTILPQTATTHEILPQIPTALRAEAQGPV